jgi:hypothetical protein
MPYRPGNGGNSNVAAVRNEQAFKYMEELRRCEREAIDNKGELWDE